MALHHDSFFIGGNWVGPSSGRRITVIGAGTEETLGSVPDGRDADIDAAVAAARRAFNDPQGWSSWAPERRVDAMERLADALTKRASEISRAVSAQNGMPIRLSEMLEGGFPSLLLRFYAELARKSEIEDVRAGVLGGSVLVRREPIGVVGAIVPWNVPQTLAAGKYAPALAAGNTIVIKPSPETVLDSILFAEAVMESGIPDGVINVVPAGREVGAYLVSHPQVDKISFTGSTAAGRQVAEACARLLRPVTVELGGKSAAIVLDDADLDPSRMAEQFVGATMANNGQACFAGTRVLAPLRRYDEVVGAVADLARGLTVGDPLDPATEVGPLASARQRDRVENYIARGTAEGARLVVGGGRPAGLSQGWYVEPTVFADVDNGHTIAREEIFGPVLSIIGYTDEDDAIRIANDSEYGLGGSVWTRDEERGLRVARQVRTGTFGINHYLPDPAGPFGGIKASGLGREFGPEGLASYQQLKSIYRP